MQISWADVSGNCPNTTLPVTLFTPSFTVIAGTVIGTNTTIRFSVSSTAASDVFSSQPVTVTATRTDLDVIGNGTVTDATDGVLIQRYLFGFTGASLTSGITLPSGTTASTIAQALNGATVLDVDGNGVVDALTDGILIRRYLLGWTETKLTDGALAISPAATRTDPAAIIAFLDSFNPMAPVVQAAATTAAAATQSVVSANTVSVGDSIGQGLLAADDPETATQDTSPVAPDIENTPATQSISTSDVTTSVQTLSNGPDVEVAGAQTASAADATNLQIVTPDPVAPVVPGAPVTFHVNYTTDPQNPNLTGLGLRMFYNSHELTLDQLSDILPNGFVQQSAPMDDTANYDGDPSTDKYVLISWADINAMWPGQTTAQLFTANLTASPDATGSTSVNFTSSSTAAGWSLDAKSAVINFLQAEGGLSGYVYVDANHNGQYDPNEGLPAVTVMLSGPVQRTTTTDDNGYYAFTGLPAGLYSINEQQPAACLNGGQHSIPSVSLTGNSQLTSEDFVEVGLRSDCIFNRILSTSTQPVGSTSWKKVVGNTMACAEHLSDSAVANASILRANSDASPTTQAPAVAHALTSAPVSRSVQIPLGRAALSTASIAPANQPTAVAGDSTSPQPAALLTTDQLKPIVTEAIAEWAKAGLPATEVAAFNKVNFSVADLSGSLLGWTENNQVLIDRDAAGYGWFVDPTPGQDEEFQSAKATGQLQAVDPRALAHMDLLTVVEHELGHVAGLNDLDSSPYDLMSSTLPEGVRRKVGVADIDAVFATCYNSDPS